jgi:hypothetical protein
MVCVKCNGQKVIRWFQTGEHVQCPECRGSGQADDCCGTAGSNQPNTYDDALSEKGTPSRRQ